MAIEARLRVRHDGCWTEALTGPQQATILGLDHERVVLVMHGGSPADVDAFVSARASDENDAKIVDRSPRTVVLRCRPCVGGIIMTTFAFGCTILWPSFNRDGHEFYHVIAPSRERIAQLVQRLREMGDVTVEAITEASPDTMHVSIPLSDVTASLTGRQLEALSVAIRGGYYDSPRRTSTEKLAAALGLSRSTYQEHLRKAERSVLAHFAGVLASHPSLSAAAKKRPGRPPATLARVAAGLAK